MILKAIPTPGHNIKGAFAEGLTSLDRVFCCSVVCAFDARLAQPITILNGLAAQASLKASWRQRRRVLAGGMAEPSTRQHQSGGEGPQNG